MNKTFEFENPAPIYRGTDFWMLNGELQDDEIRRQMTEMKNQGVYSFIARTYIGLKSDYPGKDFRARLRTILQTAKELDMKLFLQAGYMPEHVPNLPEDYALNNIRVSETPVPDEPVLCRYGTYTFSQMNSKTFLDMFNAQAVAYYLKTCYEDMWQEFSDEYGKTILSIWVDEPSYAGEYLPFPKGLPEAFRARWGYELAENVYKLYVDEGNYRSVRYHYRTLLQELLEEHYFKQLRAWCDRNGVLASGHLMGEDTLHLQIFRAGASMPFYKYFDIPGIDILAGEMNWKKNAILPIRGKYSFLPELFTTPLQCTSAARQAGSRHVLCEMYGVTSQDMNFKNQKYMFDYMAVHGINHRSVHGMFYSLKGRTKRTYPPHVNYYQPYWPQLHKLYSYVASTSCFISQGAPEADTLMIHPLASAYCEYLDPNTESLFGVQPSKEQGMNRDAAFLKLLTTLSLSHCRFDLGDEQTLHDWGTMEGNRLKVGQMSYKAVLLPDMIAMQSSTLDLLKAFVRQGGTVYVLGRTPDLMDGFETEKPIFDGLPNITYIKADEISELSELLKNTDYSFDAEEDSRSVLIRRRVEGDKAYYFLFNTDCSEEKQGTLTVHEPVSGELFDGFTKEKTPVSCRYRQGKTEIDLTLPEGGSLMLYTERITKPAESAPEKPLMCRKVYRLSDSFKAERLENNVCLLEYCSFKKGDGAYSEEYPVLAVQQMLTDEEYVGEITQRFRFHADASFTSLKLALEDVEKHHIRFNGVPVEAVSDGYYLAKDFETVPLPPCKPGENTLEITRFFSPLAKAKAAIASLFTTLEGVELESLYLLGDFALKTIQEPERNGNLRLYKKMVLTQEPQEIRGELTKAGYPFYAGTMRLSQRFFFQPAAGSKVFFTLEDFCGCVGQVFVNRIACGDLHCPPYRVDITKALIPGENELTLELTNTLRNLLGPYHRPKGEVGNLFMNGYGNPNGPWMGNHREDKTWYEHHRVDNDFWTDSYLLVSFGIKKPSLETEEPDKML